MIYLVTSLTESSTLVCVASMILVGASCASHSEERAALNQADCRYVTLPPRFCGPSEDITLWRESDPQPVRVCNGCLTDEHCDERSGGRCVELPGEGCSYSAFVCVYPGQPCFPPEGACGEGRCINRDGRAQCLQPSLER